MSAEIKLFASARETLGTGSSRALRSKGRTPSVVYGKGRENLHISLEEKEVAKLYKKGGFYATPITLEFEGKDYKVLPKKVTMHPTCEFVRHVDFVFIGSDKIEVEVPVIFENKEKSIGVKRGGFFNAIIRKVKVLCNPNDILSNITIDVSSMRIGHSYKTSQITLKEGCEFVSKNDLVLASIVGRGGKDKGEEA